MFKVENIKFNIFLENTENEMGTLAHKKAPLPLKKQPKMNENLFKRFLRGKKPFILGNSYDLIHGRNY